MRDDFVWYRSEASSSRATIWAVLVAVVVFVVGVAFAIVGPIIVHRVSKSIGTGKD